jgi:aminopeptidase
MNNKDVLLEKYADLAVRTGINIQENQTLVIMSPIECADFTRLMVEAAYKAGAKEVVVDWNDELCTKLKYLHAAEEIFENMPKWQIDFYMHYANMGAGFLSISASNPELLKDVDPKRISKNQKSRQLGLVDYYDRVTNNRNAWSIISIPTDGWASKVFPNLSVSDAKEKLWEAIFKIVRVDKADPVAAWDEHKKNLKEKMDFLNSKNLKSVTFKNSLGTDLTIELPNNHIWLGGADYTEAGIEFVANMPTEEVFTTPKKTGVNGKVISTKPLNYAGNLIDNFSLTFKDGKVCDFTAEKGYDTLKNLVEMDEGSSYLGEVALVPYDSPISNSKILFFNTLYDENASCHLALGRAYPTCIKNGENMSKEELEKAGSNTSLAHVDFMVGSKDLTIIGITKNNESFKIFENGNWVV